MKAHFHQCDKNTSRYEQPKLKSEELGSIKMKQLSLGFCKCLRKHKHPKTSHRV